MARNVRISVIGSDAYRLGGPNAGDPDAIVDGIVRYLGGKLSQVEDDRPDLIVLPEYCDIPHAYPMEKFAAFAECRGERIDALFSAWAREHACHIAYATLRKTPSGKLVDAMSIFARDGSLAGEYVKNHPNLTEMLQYGVASGRSADPIRLDFGTVGGVICFDLNFDRLRMQYVRSRPDVLLFSSTYHGGDFLQRYWAYSCRAHFAGAVRGEASAVLSPLGEPLAANTNYFDFATAEVNLDCRLVHLDYHWEKLRALKKKYGPDADIRDPGHLGAVLVTNRLRDKTIADLLDEFEIRGLDDYFAESLAVQARSGM